ncbi:copia protein, partial [Lasius niger]
MDQLTSATTVGIVKLEGAKNWNVWKFQVGVLMRGLGVFEIADGTRVKPEAEADLSAWLKEDSKAQSLIVTRLSESVMLHVLTCTSAAEMWRKLHSVYEQKSDTSIHMVQQQFF